MQLNLKGKKALVTGGSRGIGKAIVDVLAEEGCDVVVVSRSGTMNPDIAASAERTDLRLIPCAADLSTAEGVTVALNCVDREFGHLDILVNNAGSSRRADFFSLTEADWQAGFALKFFGYVRMTRAVWPLLKVGRGSVVNIIGVSGRSPDAVYALASSVNAGLLAFTKSMVPNGIRDGIRVNAVNPGQIETERLRIVLQNTGLPEEEARASLLQELGADRFGAPQDVAAMVAFLVSERANYIQGSLIDVDGGRTRGL